MCLGARRSEGMLLTDLRELPLLAVRRHLSEFTAFNFLLLFVLDVTHTSKIPDYPTVEITKRGA